MVRPPHLDPAVSGWLREEHRRGVHEELNHPRVLGVQISDPFSARAADLVQGETGQPLIQQQHDPVKCGPGQLRLDVQNDGPYQSTANADDEHRSVGGKRHNLEALQDTGGKARRNRHPQQVCELAEQARTLADQPLGIRHAVRQLATQNFLLLFGELNLLHQLVHVGPVSPLGGYPAGRRVRVIKEAASLKITQRVPDRGGTQSQPVVG